MLIITSKRNLTVGGEQLKLCGLTVVELGLNKNLVPLDVRVYFLQECAAFS